MSPSFTVPTTWHRETNPFFTLPLSLSHSALHLSSFKSKKALNSNSYRREIEKSCFLDPPQILNPLPSSGPPSPQHEPFFHHFPFFTTFSPFWTLFLKTWSQDSRHSKDRNSKNGKKTTFDSGNCVLVLFPTKNSETIFGSHSVCLCVIIYRITSRIMLGFGKDREREKHNTTTTKTKREQYSNEAHWLTANDIKHCSKHYFHIFASRPPHSRNTPRQKITNNYK